MIVKETQTIILGRNNKTVVWSGMFGRHLIYLAMENLRFNQYQLSLAKSVRYRIAADQITAYYITLLPLNQLGQLTPCI